MRHLTLLLLLLAAATAAHAQTTYTWVGGVGLWDTAANWSPAGVPGPGDTAVITAFGSEVELTSDVTVAELTLSRRLFTTTQGTDITVTGSMAWSGGGADLFASRLIIEAGATMDLTSSVTFEGFLDNYGTVTHGGSNSDLVLENGADVTNYGLYEVVATGNFAEIRGDGTFSVALTNPGQIRGVFRKAVGSGSPFVVSCFDAATNFGVANRGIVEVAAGQLRFDNEVGNVLVGDGASFTGAGGTELWIDMDYRVDPNDPTVSISGFDRVRLGNDITYEGALDVAALEAYDNATTADPDTVDVTGALISNLTTVEVRGNFDEFFLPGSVSGTLDTLRVTGFGADVTFTPGGPFDLAEVTGTGAGALLDFGGADVRAEAISVSSNAQLFGLGDLALAAGGSMDWENADVTVAGTFTVEAGATVELPGNENNFTGILANEGTFRQTGLADLVLASGSVFQNTGRYELETTNVFAEIRGDGAFVNDGVFVKGAVSTDNVRVDFTNNGTLDVREDELRFDEAFTNGATGVVTGSGTLDLTSATAFTNDGTYAPGASPGLLMHQGDFSMNGSARLVIELEGLTAGATHDQLAVEGNVALAGTLRLVHLGTYLPGLGDSYTVLTATGTVTGAFANVIAPPGYAFAVTYVAPNVVATVTGVPNFDLTAVNTSPLTVAPGGQVSFAYTIANNTGSAISGDFFYTASGGYQGIIVSGSLGGGQSLTGSFTQNVPASVPPGTYNYVLRIGSFPGGGVDAVPFQITVVAPRGEQGSDEAAPDAWTVTDVTPWPSPEALAAKGDAAEEAPSAEASALPDVFALHAAAPNPFAARTALRYDVPEAAEVRIVVYDLLGRTVAVLVDEEREAGTHAAAFDASLLPSGTYLVRMSTGGFSATQRLTRVR